MEKSAKRKFIMQMFVSIITLESIIKANKKYCPQTLLEEFKYDVKNKKVDNIINDDLELISSDESDNESDNE